MPLFLSFPALVLSGVLFGYPRNGSGVLINNQFTIKVKSEKLISEYTFLQVSQLGVTIVTLKLEARINWYLCKNAISVKISYQGMEGGKLKRVKKEQLNSWGERVAEVSEWSKILPKMASVFFIIGILRTLYPLLKMSVFQCVFSSWSPAVTRIFRTVFHSNGSFPEFQGHLLASNK